MACFGVFVLFLFCLGYTTGLTNDHSGFLNGKKFFTTVGKSPVLYCVTNTPFSAFYADSKRITSNSKYNVQDLGKDFFGYITSLQIIKATLQDEMKIVCVADGGVRVETMLKVLDPPKQKYDDWDIPIPRIPSFQSDDIGCSLKYGYCQLQCKTSSNTNTAIYKGDSEVVSSDRTRIGVTSSSIELTINPSKESDVGVYICKDGGKVALTHLNTKVTLKSKGAVTLKAGTKGELGAKIEGMWAQMPLRIRWFNTAKYDFGSYVYPPEDQVAAKWGKFHGAKSNKFEVGSHGGLVINNVQPSDAGLYVITYHSYRDSVGSAAVRVKVE